MANEEDFAEYMLLHDEDKVQEMGITLEVVECGSAEQLAEWAARRACWRWGRYPPPALARPARWR